MYCGYCFKIASKKGSILIENKNTNAKHAGNTNKKTIQNKEYRKKNANG